MSILAVVLALGAAAGYGAGDFAGGFATRRCSALTVLVSSHAIGLALALVAVPLLGGHGPIASDLAWGAGAGLTGGVGVVLLYIALASGAMSVAAPTTAAVAAGVPVVGGLLLRERPGALALVGVVLAIGAVALLGGGAPDVPVPLPEEQPGGVGSRRLVGASTRPSRLPSRGLLAAFGAGAAFGLFYICLGRTGGDSGLWPVVAARVVSLSLGAIVALASGRALVARGAGLPTLVAGVLDMVANILYLLAVHRGLLSLVAVLASLYPATTVACAVRILGERLTRRQLTGLGLAPLAVALIAV